MASDSEDIPLLFDHYAVERKLGAGAMGVVYLARDLRIGRLVALKTLRRQANHESEALELEAFNRFRREAQVCASLLHSNVVTLYEIGAQANRFVWMAMEYVDGESLASILARRGKLPVETAAAITLDILRGLSYAHDRGVVHRDIKPANVLVGQDGAAKIADFGIASATDANLTEITDRGRLLGTPHYMSPEQVAGRRVDGRSDVFSVGVLFYEMVTGRKPFDSNSLTEVLYSVVNSPAPSLRTIDPELPRWCSRWVERTLEKQPANRWPDAGAAARELRHLAGLPGEERALAGLAQPQESAPDLTPTTPITSPPRPALNLSRQISARSAILVILAIVVLLGGGITWGVREIVREPVAQDGASEVELLERRQLLREANVLLEAGAYRQALERYDEYLQRWPSSAAALEGKAKAEAALTKVTNLRQ